MQYVKRMSFALCAIVLAIFSIPVLAGSEDAGERVMKGMGKMHVPFIANEGQVDERVAFYADTFGGTVYVTKKGEIVYSLPKHEKDASDSKEKESAPHKRHIHEEAQSEESMGKKGVVLKEETVEGFEPNVAGGEKAETIVNYFKGNDPEQWRSNIPTYKSISLGEIYPGVKLELKAYGNNVEKIFHVEPGIDPSVIQLKLSGATGIQVDEGGELKIETEFSPASFTVPVAYQYIDGKKVEVTAAYTIKKPDPLTGENSLVYGFQVGKYDATKELIIDPLLASTYLGGSSYDDGYAIALDSSGNVYVTGATYSSGFPTTSGAYDNSYNAINDVFVAKLDSSLSSLQASTYLGGSDDDYGYAIALDTSGNVYVTGYTTSSDFPTTSGAYDTYYNYVDVFVAKLDSSLSSLQASTYLGGSDYDYGYAIVLDTSGNVYVTGYTLSSDFPTTSGAYDTSYDDGGDVFVAKLDSSLTNLHASTYLGGSDHDYGGYAIVLDTSGNVYVTGETSSSDFPMTSGAYDTSYNDGRDVFVAKLNSSLTNLHASTYLGGSEYDFGYAIVLDANGNVYVTGYTLSSDFPTTSGAYDTSYNSEYDVFVSKLNSSLTSLQASTYLGGSDYDRGYAIALDASGNVYVTGSTYSSDFPTTSEAYDTSYNSGYYDLFVSKLNSSLSDLQASTYMGGSSSDIGYAIVLDGSGNVYVTGYTYSSDFPTTSGAYDTSGEASSSYRDVFIAKLDSNLSASPPTSTTGSASNITDTAATLNGTVNANNGVSTTAWFEYGITSGSYSYSTTTQTVTGSSDTSISASISDLSAETTYYYRIAAQNSVGTTYGSEVSFTTSAAPTATTGDATDATSSTATLNGAVNANGSDTTVWFEYGNSSGSYTNTTTTQTVTGSGSNSVSAGIRGLTADTKYYYRIAASNAGGASYGEAKTFTTGSTAATTGIITGTVIDADKGEPVEDVKVTAKTKGAKETVYTDSEGNFEFTDVAQGKYTVSTKKKGYQKAKKKITLDSGEEEYIEFELKSKK